MQVREIMTQQVKTVRPSDSIKKAAEIMRSVDCGSVPVTEGDRVVGIVTDRDIVVKQIASGKSADSPVKECMTDTVVTVKPDAEAQTAADMMADNQVRRLPVVDNGRLVGILAIADLARKHIYVSESGQALSEISEPSRQSNAVH
ncbi:MAG: CBS domain-containing protein [Thermaerobacter sp.]|nr:CBS domain-containing protein [Thermaerobacter sp.]